MNNNRTRYNTNTSYYNTKNKNKNTSFYNTKNNNKNTSYYNTKNNNKNTSYYHTIQIKIHYNTNFYSGINPRELQSHKATNRVFERLENEVLLQ